jgi:F-type H+-transporting ATPase subunit delta
MTKSETSTKRETVLDVTRERIARVYAQAFWSAAAKQADSAALVDEIRSVESEVLEKFPALNATLSTELINHEHKERILDRLFAKHLSPTVLNFLKVLSAHGRLGILRSVIKEIGELHLRQLNQTRVEVRVAAELNDEIRGEIEKVLHERLKSEPILHVVIDPEIVGGVVIQIGDRVFDGSLKTRFEMARKSIIARAIDKIETQPERFIASAS